MPAPAYPSGPFSSGMAIGSYDSGSDFISTAQVKVDGKWQLTGHVVKSIVVWTNGSCLTAIRVTFTEGRADQYGQMKGSTTEFAFEAGEAITLFKLWGNGIGTRAGRIEFDTNRGRKFAAGRDVAGQTTYVHPNIGSGIVAGIYGKAGAEIDCVGFVFLEPIESVKVRNFNYETSFKAGNLANVMLDKATYPLDEDWKMESSLEIEESREISTSATLRFGVQAGFQASVPELAEVNETISWEFSAAISMSSKTLHKRTLTWSIGHVAQDDKKDEMVEITVLCKQGTLQSVPFTSDVQIRFRSGVVHSYQERGLLDSTVFSETYYQEKFIAAPKVSGGSK